MAMILEKINIEIDTGDVIQGLIEDFGIEDIIDFVDELIERVGDDDFTHGLYEMARLKHEDWLANNDISEEQYRKDYADSMLYEDEEEVLDTNEMCDEQWITDTDDNVDDGLILEE